MLVEFTIGGAVVSGLGWYLVRFLSHLVLDFKNTLDNHLQHNTIALTELSMSIQENTRVMQEIARKHL